MQDSWESTALGITHVPWSWTEWVKTKECGPVYHCFGCFSSQGFLKNERENALLSVIEQTRKHVSLLTCLLIVLFYLPVRFLKTFLRKYRVLFVFCFASVSNLFGLLLHFSCCIYALSRAVFLVTDLWIFCQNWCFRNWCWYLDPF